MNKLQFDPGEVPPYAFCEATVVSGCAPWHIRKIGSRLFLGGGVDSESLCGRVKQGWDLNVRISEHHLTHACEKCVALYRAAAKGSQ